MLLLKNNTHGFAGNFVSLRVGYAEVNLGAGDVLMPEALLDEGNRDVLTDQVSTERMLENVWVTASLIDASAIRNIIEQAVDLRTVHSRGFTRGEHEFRALCL